MRGRLVSTRPPWWPPALPLALGIAAAYVLVVLGAAGGPSLAALAFAAAFASDILVLVPIGRGAREVELCIGGRGVRLSGPAPLGELARIDEEDVRALRLNATLAGHEIVVDLGHDAPIVLEVAGGGEARSVAAALGGARASTQRVAFPTGPSPRRRRARSLAATSIVLLALGSIAIAGGGPGPSFLLLGALATALYAVVHALTDFGQPTVWLDPRALHTAKARLPLETVSRIEETSSSIAITSEDGVVTPLLLEVGPLSGDVSPAERALLARSLACAVDAVRPAHRTIALDAELRRGARTAREWLADLDALARTACGHGYRAALRVEDLARVASDERTDDELRLAATRVLYCVAPEGTVRQEVRFLRVASDDEEAVLAAFADLERRRTWR